MDPLPFPDLTAQEEQELILMFGQLIESVQNSSLRQAPNATYDYGMARYTFDTRKITLLYNFAEMDTGQWLLNHDQQGNPYKSTRPSPLPSNQFQLIYWLFLEHGHLLRYIHQVLISGRKKSPSSSIESERS